MSVWGKILGAAAGLALGGPLGALLGVIAGHYAIDRAGETPPVQPPQADERAGTKEVAFTIAVIALAAKIAKADGVVTPAEIRAFRQVFQIPPGEERNVARVFDLAREQTAGFEAYAKQAAGLFRPGSVVLEELLDGLFFIAQADGAVTAEELDYLERVAAIFGFDAQAFGRIRESHVGPDSADPYRVLGVSRDLGFDAIKKEYRRLVREHHPDKLTAQGLPPEFISVATEKLAAFNDAYAKIEKERAGQQRAGQPGT